MMLRYETSAKAAQVLGITVEALGVQERDDFNSVFATMDSDPPEAILMVSELAQRILTGSMCTNTP